MELLLGLGIVALLLAVVAATHSDAAPQRLSDAGLQAQVEAMRQWLQTHAGAATISQRRKRRVQQRQRYLSALLEEARRRGLPPPDAR